MILWTEESPLDPLLQILVLGDAFLSYFSLQQVTELQRRHCTW